MKPCICERGKSAARKRAEKAGVPRPRAKAWLAHEFAGLRHADGLLVFAAGAVGGRGDALAEFIRVVPELMQQLGFLARIDSACDGPAEAARQIFGWYDRDDGSDYTTAAARWWQ